MGKKKRTIHTEESTMDWPFEINIDIRSSPKTKVAFLSSQSRTYFPEDPGVSRFGVEYSMNCAPGDVPNPKYFPSDDRLQKPISTKGFGIGGLTGPRFEKEYLANNPAPNAYQQETSIKPLPASHALHHKKKKKSKKGNSLVDHDEPVVEANTSPPPPQLNEKALRDLCLQNVVGFGAHLTVNRFGRDPTFNNVGVGYYDINKRASILTKIGCFGNGPVTVVPPTITRCNYKGYDKCFGCDTELRMVDYYRTRMKVPDPTQEQQEKQEIIKSNEDQEVKSPPPPLKAAAGPKKPGKKKSTKNIHISNMKLIYVSLCRKCYCRGMRGESKIWNRNQMLYLFRKTRHCSYIHDHRNMPEFVHKTSCDAIRKVQKKEALMSIYYKDACERVLKEK